MEFMTVLRRRGALLLAMALLPSGIAVPGCGDGKPYTDTSMNEASVTGVVKANGEPVTGGIISFNASNSGRVVPERTAEIGPDGRYSLKAFTGDNRVGYGGELAKKYTGVGLRKDFAAVESGENTFDFDILGSRAMSTTIDPSKMKKPKKK